MPAASKAPYTSGRRSRSRWRQRATTMCGYTICGAVQRNARAASTRRLEVVLLEDDNVVVRSRQQQRGEQPCRTSTHDNYAH